MNCPANHSNRLEFEYDSQGRRISKDVCEWDSSQSLWSKVESLSFVYDGWNLISEVRSQGSEVSTNLFTWGLDLSGSTQGAGGVGGLLSVTVAGGDDPGTFFPCFDANGNITEYVDEDGGIAAHYEYSPFGEITAQSGDNADDFRFRFSTKYLDETTGWYYYGYRYYSPDLGRWPNRDPLEERGGLNLYVFCQNNPINFIDLLGREGLDYMDGIGARDEGETDANLTAPPPGLDVDPTKPRPRPSGPAAKCTEESLSNAINLIITFVTTVWGCPVTDIYDVSVYPRGNCGETDVLIDVFQLAVPR